MELKIVTFIPFNTMSLQNHGIWGPLEHQWSDGQDSKLEAILSLHTQKTVVKKIIK